MRGYRANASDPVVTPSEARRIASANRAAAAVRESGQRSDAARRAANQEAMRRRQEEEEAAAAARALRGAPTVRIKEEPHVIEISDGEDEGQGAPKADAKVEPREDLWAGLELPGADEVQEPDQAVELGAESIQAAPEGDTPVQEGRAPIVIDEAEAPITASLFRSTPTPAPDTITTDEIIELEPWPPHFVELGKCFKALNTVHSFCAARKHLATTFDTIKSSVQALLGRPLEMFDIAQCKSLLPDLISFAYVEAEYGSDEEDEDDLRIGPSTPPPRPSQVLLFDFNDGTLQGPKATARGGAKMRKIRKLKPAPKLNSFPSTASMRRLIDKRNRKFEEAVNELLAACRAKEEDPVQLLIAAAEEHVPVDAETRPHELQDTPRKKRLRLDYLLAHPEERPSISAALDEMQGQEWWKEQVVPGGRRTIAARPARYDQLTFALTQELVDALWDARGIEEFFTHQAQALNALEDGKNVIVSTATSSGKSLIYQVPVLRVLEEDPRSTALFMFPTKALAQDQRTAFENLIDKHAKLAELAQQSPPLVSTYDGDTPKELRAGIRANSAVVLTNPDMLHASILPNEAGWRRFLRGLRYVVVDELHIYNGLFGAHVAFVMRRLRRLCAALGNSRVQFIACSATVANPDAHFRTLFALHDSPDVTLVNDDGSPSGQKEWAVWNPPLIDDADPAQGRVSAYAEASRVFRHLVERGIRTILFAKQRRSCEIVISQVRNDLLQEGRSDVAKRVLPYRSGYSAQDRRRIEREMGEGRVMGLVATSALELGIDVGALDAVIMLGFPYSISSLRQQAGRAGRRQKDSLALLIGDPFPADQYYMQNPSDIFEQPDAELTIDLDNDFILEAHLQCAADEMPIEVEQDEAFFGPRIAALCRARLEPSDEGPYFGPRSDLLPNPARSVALRGARQVTYAYVDERSERVLEEVELDRAIFEAFDGAVFYHQGIPYLCTGISHDIRMATMRPAPDVSYHTRPRDHTDTDAVEVHRIRALKGSDGTAVMRAFFGHVRLSTHVWGFFKVDRRANILDAVDLAEAPPFIRDTHGLWIDLPLALLDALVSKSINVAAAIHAAEHAILSLTPMFIVTLAGDVQTECKIAEREYARGKATSRRRPARLIFYDTPGQSGGVTEKAFEHLDGLIRIAIAVIESCACLEGCPSCVTSHTCAHANAVTSKVGALGVLRGLIGLEPFDEDLPPQNERGHAEGILGDSGAALAHTVAVAEAVPMRGEVQVEEHQERIPPGVERALRLGRGVAPSRPPVGGSLQFQEPAV